MKLKVRVVHYRCQGRDCWYADIDDAEDRQPDDPYWYADGCRSQAEAISVACTQLAALDQAVAVGTRPRRISEATPDPTSRIGESVPDSRAQQSRGVGVEKAVA